MTSLIRSRGDGSVSDKVNDGDDNGGDVVENDEYENDEYDEDDANGGQHSTSLSRPFSLCLGDGDDNYENCNNDDGDDNDGNDNDKDDDDIDNDDNDDDNDDVCGDIT